jgi:hypothetical protein
MSNAHFIVDFLLEGGSSPIVPIDKLKRFYDYAIKNVSHIKSGDARRTSKLVDFLNDAWKRTFSELGVDVVFVPEEDLTTNSPARYEIKTGKVEVKVVWYMGYRAEDVVKEVLPSLFHELVHSAQYRNIPRVSVEKASERLAAVTKHSADEWKSALTKSYGDSVDFATLHKVLNSLRNRYDYSDDPMELQARAGERAFGAIAKGGVDDFLKSMRSGRSFGGGKTDVARKKFLKSAYKYLQ